MKISSRQRVSRRDLVRLLGSAVFALPGLELFGREVRAQAATKTAKYAVFCYTPNGVNQDDFWPTGTEWDFQLGPILEPFQNHKDKILVLGPQMNGGTSTTGSGLAYAGPTPQHQAPVTLSARLGKGCEGGGGSCVGGTNRGLPYLDQSTASNDIDGPSIDHVIGKQKPGTLFLSLNFGLHPVGGDTPSEINFDENGVALKRLETADDAWNWVFGTPVVPVSEASAHKTTAVTDFLYGRFQMLSGQVSSYDRSVLDTHLTSLRAYEERVKKRGTATCSQPARAEVPTDDTAVRTGSDTQQLCPFFMDLISASFACDMTHVASITFGYPGGGDAGGLRMPWLGFTDPLHGVSHHARNATQLEKYTKMSQWVASQIAGLMDRLAVAKDSAGVSLLEQTVIYWFNRHGDGDTHTNYALPNILLGGSGGYFRMGRFLRLPATSPTKVLISMANSMGVDPGTFGEFEFSETDALAGLV